MRSIEPLFALSVGIFAGALYACATSSNTNNGASDAGNGNGSSAGGGTGSSGGTGNGNGNGMGNASGAGSSGAGNGNGAASSSGSAAGGSSSSAAGGSSSSGAGGSSSSGGGGDDAAGDDGGDSTAVEGNCPDTCPDASQSCCLVNMAGTVWGVCATQAACTAQGGGFLACGSPDDCGGAASATPACCLMGAGAFPSTVCMASCPAGSSPACNVDGTTCPNGGAGFDCSPVSPSIPVDAIGTCTPSASGAGDDSGSAE